MDKKKLGKRIKSVRLSKEIKAKDLAKDAKISASYLSEVENGLATISGERLLRIAKELGVTLGFLMEEEVPESASHVKIPNELAKAAEGLNLPYNTVLALLEGHNSLFARRASTKEREWEMADWLEYYEKVKPYLAE